MASSNYLTKVAIVGAGGNSGSHMTRELLKTGKHTVTAITREDSQNKLPEGVKVAKVDYSRRESLVAALRGQDALVITLNVFAGGDTQKQLINAAAEAGVLWVLPNDWSPDTTNEAMVKDCQVFQGPPATRKYITESSEKLSYISVSTGFWYEWSLAIAPSYGFDFANKSVTLFDEGNVKISTSTWPQVGRAVAGLLSLPIMPEGSGESLQDFTNKVVYVSSFTVNQNEMLDSVLRVTGDKRQDWKISKEPVHERYATGAKQMQDGDRVGFVKMMYSRVFYPDGCGDIEHKGTVNALLGLPKENLDEATKVAIERAKAPGW